jgi:hypothetical protein
MKRTFRLLLNMYPPHVRAIYADEMRAAFESALDRCVSRWSRLRFCSMSILATGIDAAVERLWTLGSHPSFSGCRPTDLGVVRPPNMSKAEWFGSNSTHVD